MSVDANTVLREALTLPPGDRAEIAAELVASLDEPHFDDPAAVRAEWARELDRRARRALSGEDPGEAWPALRDRVRNSRPR